MDEAYAVKQTQFLGKSVSYVCQNANGPCPLLAIANVLLLRGQLTLEDVVEPPGFVTAQDLMSLVHRRLLHTNPPMSNASELQRLTQEKTLKDVAEMLPSMLVGLDVNVRFHNITDFEYTVACAVFDMLDIVLVHGWLLDDQDDQTLKVVGNKSYNELIERLVDYRGILLTEEAIAKEKEARPDAGVLDTPPGLEGEEEEKPAVAALLSPLVTQTAGFQNLSIDVNSTSASPDAVRSPSSTSSMTSPKKSPSQQTVRTMMKERHMSDADALDTATTLLEEGPVLEEFFNSTASQLTYYGLVKLHEGLRERQLCVFFRNNHFSTLFKFEGALYLLVTDAGYLDEPTVVWELLNEIDGDTEYLNAQFRPVTSSEQQENILTQQQKQREQDQEEQQQLEKARALSLSGCVSPSNGMQPISSGDTRNAELTMPSGGLFGESGEQEDNLDPDYLLALRFQKEEEELARANKRVSPRISPRHLQSIGADREAQTSENEDSNIRSESSAQDEDRRPQTSESDFIPVSADGQMMISEEELEAQRQAERFYQEQKRQVDAQTRQYQQEQERQRQHHMQQQQIRSGQGRRPSGGGDCTIS
ncbi:Ubiquitin carboxyl-terminal hydrolase MINDY-1 [Phytophthora citrophthora]|uniref:Ubiquitin carboxyl-terminal hydrolase MINDY-1 n=1 Tax=Phytophthora citrophthora TaxID=4793 RepID=A0AAD9LUZ6_9STRA|nr:Ubiquitin carboxyl-terminal hydrolase MINDY-1 [Phytophthora citrophthora]